MLRDVLFSYPVWSVDTEKAGGEKLKEEETKKDKRIDWHSGFAGGLELGFRRYRNEITIEREHLLSKEPLRVDFLLLKKRPDAHIDNAIGRGLLGHNIIEYKNPEDMLNIDVVWKVIGYAGIYKSLGHTVDEIRADDITISIVRTTKPKVLIKQLQEKGKTIENVTNGVYRVIGVVDLIIQIIVISELKDRDFLALKILVRNADFEEVKAFVEESSLYELQGEKKDAEAVLLTSSKANAELYRRMRGEKDMHEWLKEFLKDDIIEAEENAEAKGEKKALIKQVCRKIKKGKSLDEILFDIEDEENDIKDIYNVIIKHGSDCDPEKIYEIMLGEQVQKV